MRIIKTLIFVCVLYFSLVALYPLELPQYLESQDIDIYTSNAREVIDLVVHRLNNPNQFEIELTHDFYRLFDIQYALMVIGTRDAIFIPDISFDFNANSYGDGGAYISLINSNVPDDLDELFLQMGWVTNGHQKFWTIYFYHWYLRILRNRFLIDDEYMSDMISRIRMDDSINIATRLLGSLNSNDIDIIISNWDTVENIYNR